MDERLTADERDFLERIRDGRRLKPADRVEDKVRQRMRRAGLAEILTKPRRWSLTEAGRAMLAAAGGRDDKKPAVCDNPQAGDCTELQSVSPSGSLDAAGGQG